MTMTNSGHLTGLCTFDARVATTAAMLPHIRATEPTAATVVGEVDRRKREIAGVIAPYGEVTRLAPGGPERIARGAFNGSFDAGNPRQLLFVAHDHGKPIGRATSIWESSTGLCGRFRISNGTRGSELLDEIDEGLWPALSCGFHGGEHVRGTDGVRTLTRAALAEISLVALPAYTGAVLYEVGDQPVERAVPAFALPPVAPRSSVDLAWVDRRPPPVDLSPLPKRSRW